MPERDAIVVGLGAVGAATLYQLARRGARVLGIDRFAPPHALGSSHGRSRIIREAYFESPLYVPLVRRAYELWGELEAASGTTILRQTGGLMLGPPDGAVVAGALASARQHALPYEELSAAEVVRRFPGFRPTVDMVGVWEPRAGWLAPERAIAAHLALAARHGAELRTTEPVLRWRAGGGGGGGGGVEVTTAYGTYAARRLVLAAGAWTRALLGPALDLPHEILDAAEVHRRVPGMRVTSDMVGVWEPRAGFLVPEAAIAAHLALAAEHGAELHADEPVLAWEPAGEGVLVTTARGTYRARRLVLAAGAWMPALLGGSAPPLAVERVVQHWFRPARPTDLYAPSRFPVFIGEYAPGLAWYGFPDVGDGVKAALHHQGEAADPDTVRRSVAPEEVAYVRALLRAFMPDADGPCVDSTVCMYTNTPDEHFVIDTHPAHPQVVVASACSGHGFKFSSAVGELLADLALGTAPAFDLAPFRLGRFSQA